MTEPNRRKFIRVKPKQLATRVRWGEELHIGLGIENISLGGTFVRCNTPLKAGREVTLELVRPGASQPIALPGRVTSVVTLAEAQQSRRAAGMGIAFDPLPPHLQARLEGLIGAIDPTAVRELPPPAPPPAKPKPKAPAPPAALSRHDPAQLLREIEVLKAELQTRNRKIEELLSENKSLWQKIRTLDV